MKENKRHFLVIASASRGARFFIKKALMQGHDVTAICRAESDKGALERMNALLSETKLSPGGAKAAEQQGMLQAKNSNILDPETYKKLLEENPSIDAMCCFVGATKVKDMVSPKCSIYTDTILAMVEGMRASHWVEVFYHSSVGSEGKPGESVSAWPANYLPFSNLIHHIFPIFKNVTKSENLLAAPQSEGLKVIIFRPAALHDRGARRRYGYSFDRTYLKQGSLPLKYAKISIGREDTAEEILRVATLPKEDRTKWHGHAVYLVDLKEGYEKEQPNP